MKATLLSIFPEMLNNAIDYSILKRARLKNIADIECIDIRDYASGRHKIVDDYLYGGGAGMLMKPEPLFKAVDFIVSREKEEAGEAKVIITSPQGKLFCQEKAVEFSLEKRRLIFICGHYEGIDERVLQGLGSDSHLEVEEISIGNYVLTGGEIAAIVMLDASVRLIHGVLGNAESLSEETFSCGLVDSPKYTRPQVYRGMKVPDVLLSGNHGEIKNWRRETAVRNTKRKRPDLL